MHKVSKSLMANCLLILFFGQTYLSNAQNTSKNKRIASRYFEEVINQQKIDLIPQLLAENYIYYDLHSFSESQGNVKSFQELMTSFFKAFPDTHYIVKNMIAEDNKVYAEIMFTATQKGDFMNIAATNKPIKISEAYLFTFNKGKIVESRRLVDFSAFFEQLNSKP